MQLGHVGLTPAWPISLKFPSCSLPIRFSVFSPTIGSARFLLNYEAGFPTAAPCANFTGKTSTLFPICALWTPYSFPGSRVMYLSATGAQVKNQFP